PVSMSRPNCAGGCYQYSSFDSVEVGGEGFLGVDCIIYCDYNCQNEVPDTCNEWEGNLCVNIDTPGAQSLRCF
ncbi:hypothetical protein C8F04DRAFT_884951, partial [Mycena alexandri]